MRRSILKRYRVEVKNIVFFIAAKSLDEAADTVRAMYPGWSFTVSDW